MISELDTVALTEDLPEHGLQAGDIGTVTLVHEQGQAYEVEFATLAGHTLAVLTLESGAIRPTGEHEIAHVRAVAHG